MTFSGFDIDIYPGAVALQDAKTQGFSWCASYLDAPSHLNASWPDYPILIASGLNILPIWVGAQVVGPGSHAVGPEAGATEGHACVAELAAKLYPTDIGVVFDTENGPPVPPLQTEHLTAWRDAVRAGGYRPMVYGSHLNFVALAAIFGANNVWSVDLRSTDPQSFLGVAVQCQQEVPLTLVGKTYSVDRSLSLVADPSAPAQNTVSGNATFAIAQQPEPALTPQPEVPLPATAATPLEQQPAAVAPIPTPPIPLTPSVPQLAPAFTPAPVAATGPTLTTVATPARVGATVALTGLVAGATAMSQTPIVSVKNLIDLAFVYLVSPIVLGIVVGLATSLAKLLNINMQSALAQRVLTEAENGASAVVSKAQTAADDHATFSTKDQMIAGTLNYLNTAAPDAVKALGLATPAGQAQLANLAEAKVQQVVAAIPTKVTP